MVLSNDDGDVFKLFLALERSAGQAAPSHN